jgi:hypothetical protein
MTFNEWLVEKGYVSDISQIEYELSANEADQLYQIWTDETGGAEYIQENLNIPDVSESDSTDLEAIEDKIIECLNEADDKLDSDDFNRLAERIINCIDEIARSKR